MGFGRSVKRRETGAAKVKGVPVRNLTEDEWSHIRAVGRVVNFADGAYLANEGAREHTVFAIETGVVSIVLAGQGGNRYLVGSRSVGDLVGEMAAIDGLARSASIVAKGPVVARVLTSDQFRLFLSNHPEAAIRIMQSMARRIRQAAAMHTLQGGALNSRVVATLLAMAADLGEVVGTQPGSAVELKMTQQELADWVGATREATARVLADLRARGLIQTARGRIVVLDPDGLGALKRSQQD